MESSYSSNEELVDLWFSQEARLAVQSGEHGRNLGVDVGVIYNFAYLAESRDYLFFSSLVWIIPPKEAKRIRGFSDILLTSHNSEGICSTCTS